MAEWKAIRIANPRRKARAKVAKKKVRRWKSPSRRKTNPGPVGGVLTLMANPKKRKKRNPWAKARRRNAVPKAAKSRRRKNPTWIKMRNKRRNSGRRRNPIAVAGKDPISMLKLGVSAAGGAIGTRAITNLALRSKNAGWLGYSVNIVVALGLGYLGGKMSEEVGLGLMVGGLGSTAQRIWDDKVSGVLPAAAAVVQSAAASAGASVPAKSLGDVSYSDDGLGRALLGEYVSASFPLDVIRGPYISSGGTPSLPPAGTGTSGKAGHLSGAAW